jgi:VIT1/CCC1 family predicted Fe2+/Mn2+ transporter
MGTRHWEQHRGSRIGWLRAAVLGANDGIVSTASLVLGVAAAGAGTQAVLVAGVGGAGGGGGGVGGGGYRGWICGRWVVLG